MKTTTLLVIRHGKAEERDPIRYPNDDLRPLTSEGIRESALLGPAVDRMGFVIDRLYSSPLTRARQTADGLHTSSEAIPVPIETDLLGHAASQHDVPQEGDRGARPAGSGRRGRNPGGVPGRRIG